jgi:hypothetical protein
MSLRPGCLTRFWLWAGVGVLAMLGSFSFGTAPLVWALNAACIGLLAARSVSPRRAAIAIAVGLAAPPMVAVVDSPWPVLAGPVAALAVAMVHSRRDALVLAAALATAIGSLLILSYRDDAFFALVIAPVLVIVAALIVGRPQREAAGALTGAGLALVAFGAFAAGISLTLAGAVLMLTLSLRRRRLAAAITA